MKLKVLTASALVAASLGFPAFATVIEGTITGSISSGFDEFDTFGTGQTALDGQSYQVNFSYDTDLGSSYQQPGDTELWGGSVYGSPSPMSVQLVINGVSLDLGGYDDFMYQCTVGPCPTDEMYVATTNRSDDASDLFAYGYFSMLLQTIAGVLPVDLTQPLDLTLADLTSFSGTFGYSACLQDVNDACTQELADLAGSMTLDRLSLRVVSAVAPVPLPAGAGLLLLALAGLAVTGRRRLA